MRNIPHSLVYALYNSIFSNNFFKFSISWLLSLILSFWMISKVLTFSLFLTRNIKKFYIISQNLIGIQNPWNVWDGLWERNELRGCLVISWVVVNASKYQFKKQAFQILTESPPRFFSPGVTICFCLIKVCTCCMQLLWISSMYISLLFAFLITFLSLWFASLPI